MLARPVRSGARPAALLGLAPLLLVAVPSPASAAGAVARWEMNEGRTAHVLHDASGHHLDGAIGSDVDTHVVTGGRTGFAFPYLHNGVAPAHPAHLVTVPSRSELNPGTGDYAVTLTLRYKPGANGSNVFQKGQAGSPGGYVKLEVHSGRVSCLFRGSDGSAAVGTGVLSDGAWHTVRCARPGGDRDDDRRRQDHGRPSPGHRPDRQRRRRRHRGQGRLRPAEGPVRLLPRGGRPGPGGCRLTASPAQADASPARS